MDNDIYKLNYAYLENWISLNPNLKNITYFNNILKTPSGEEIDLKNFLVSELLNNEYFKNNKYSMRESEFIKIIKLHTGSENILNDLVYKESENSKDNNEYVKNVKLNKLGNAVIITSELNNYEIKDVPANKVLFAYHSLIQESNYLPLNDLLKKINKEDLIIKSTAAVQYIYSILNIKFFNLINSDNSLNIKESNYIQSKSKFMFYLLLYQDLLTGNAKKLLDMYNVELNRISSLNKISIAQKYALHFYNKNLEALENLKKEQEKKEAVAMHRASNGYTSLILLLFSVLVTGIFITILYFS